MADITSRLPTQDQSDGAAGSAAPSEAIQVAGTDGTNLRVLSTTTGGHLIVEGAGVPGTPAGGVLTVQGNTSDTTIPVSGTVTAKIEDTAGNALSSQNSQLLTADFLNTSSQYRAQSVTTTAAEALGGSTILSNRKLLTITPTNGTIYWGYNSSVTTTTGTPLFAFQTLFLSVGVNNHVYVIAAATTDSRVGELS